MQFSYFHLMPYTATTRKPDDWPVPNHDFDAKVANELYAAYIDSMVFAESCGFDWIGSGVINYCTVSHNGDRTTCRASKAGPG